MNLPPPRPWTRADWWALAALLVVAAGLSIPRLRGPLDLRYDAGVYYILGTSLAEGKGYRLLNEPGAIQAVQYPPVLPLVAAAQERLLGTTDPAVVGHWLRISAILCFLAYAVTTYLLGHRFLPTRYAFLGALIAVLQVQTLFLSDSFAADVPYALISSLFFLAGGGPVAGFLAVTTFGLRTAGIALLGAWAAEALLRRRYRNAALRAAVAIAAVGGWQMYTARVKAGPEYAHPAYSYQRADYQYYNVGYVENMRYVDPFQPELGRASARQWASRLWANAGRIPSSLGEAVSLHRGWWRGEANRIEERFPSVVIPDRAIDVALAFISLLVIAGMVLLAMDGHWMVVLYVLGSILLIVITPWPGQFTRYLIPLTPFLTLSLVTATGALATHAARSGGGWRWASRAAAVTIVSILIQQVYTLHKTFTRHHEPATIADASGRIYHYRLFFYDRTWQLHDEALTWLARQSKGEGVVATSTPHLTYLKTGLRAIMPPYELDPSRAEQLLDEVPVTYLVVDNLEFLDV
ncbi:MAG: hypothetical protein ABI766_08650, partial [Gemmatimonadales bacterium]